MTGFSAFLIFKIDLQALTFMLLIITDTKNFSYGTNMLKLYLTSANKSLNDHFTKFDIDLQQSNEGYEAKT